jgi:ADP-heptose:LPS heptosyltransferase
MIKVFLPFRGEFGHLLMWHAPAVNAHEGDKIVCCEYGQEGLFPGVAGYYFVDPRPEDKKKTANAHNYDKEVFEKIKKDRKVKFPDADFIEPTGEYRNKDDKKYLVYQPHVNQGINCDIVVCPRKRALAPGRNWEHWIELTKKLQEIGYSVFAAGSPSASYDVPCKKAWDYDRFCDATIEAILSSKLVVCTDSGLAHLSVQCAKPILMITNKGQPGPGSRWKVKWPRYKAENHKSSKIETVDDWNNLSLVVQKIQKIVGDVK